MRISPKGRNALASDVYLAQRFTSGEYVTVMGSSEGLGILK
jgi:hypothetical protein